VTEDLGDGSKVMPGDSGGASEGLKLERESLGTEGVELDEEREEVELEGDRGTNSEVVELEMSE
jgi:hypothetical protein